MNSSEYVFKGKKRNNFSKFSQDFFNTNQDFWKHSNWWKILPMKISKKSPKLANVSAFSIVPQWFSAMIFLMKVEPRSIAIKPPTLHHLLSSILRHKIIVWVSIFITGYLHQGWIICKKWNIMQNKKHIFWCMTCTGWSKSSRAPFDKP